MIKANFAHTALDALLSDKSLSADARRRVVATSTALDLIALAMSKDKPEHTLADEMKNLPAYAEAIYTSLGAD